MPKKKSSTHVFTQLTQPFFILLVLAGLFSFSAIPLIRQKIDTQKVLGEQQLAQDTQYEDSVEYIRYVYPNLRDENGTPFDAPKKIGSQTPTLRMYIWGDLDNQFTRRFFNEMFDELLAKYGAETQFSYHHRAFIKLDRSIFAGMVGECAAEQGHFWENVKPILNSYEQLESFTYLINIDQAILKKCMEQPNTKTIITTSEDQGMDIGFNGIPTFVIQDVTKSPTSKSIKISGVQDISVFHQAFQEAKLGSVTRQELQNLEAKIENIEQNVNQTQDSVAAVQEKQSFLETEINQLRNLVQGILQSIANFF